MTDTTTTVAAELAELGEAYFTTQHSYDPFNATLLGVDEFDGLSFDPSREASERTAQELAALGRRVREIDTAGLTTAQRVDHAVLTALVEGARSDAEHSLWAANASAKSYVSRQGLIFQAVPAMTAASPEGVARYLSRLSKLGATLDALGQRYLVEAADGRTPTAVGVDHSIRQLEGYLALPVSEDALLKPVHGVQPAVREAATAHIAQTIRPAMQRLAELLRRELAPLARPDDRVGIREVPGGEAGYLAAVARHTTTTLSPRDIHEIGLAELDELAGLWSQIGRDALGESDFATIAARMRDDPALRFRTREEIIAVAQDALDRAEAVRDAYFVHYDIPGCVIEEINPIDAENTAMAYYRPPAVDGSRPGAHCLLATNPAERYRYEYEALAFHESVPGHHLQLATAQTLDIPRYRRHIDAELCAFNEGWGLYSERLADEIGLYSDPVMRLGMLSFAALRACRLVVDTGMHQLGWSRQQAMDFMYEHTATTRAHVRNEVDRYIAWPGQALAYVTGKREITRLRERAQQALGPRFDIRQFHHAVLRNGAIPLSSLDDEIERWTATEA
ncbi:MAG TPA: DUF885 domain-containing protein [Trebonia sp.]|jgi:uncharacterized protein (DUF885 family)|nr:DUF885 domain-containing protein [Trebonia sp.]